MTRPVEITISEKQWKQICDLIYKNILRNLDAGVFLLNHDSELAAGLYTYALEEFGKLILLTRGVFNNGVYRILYRDQFVNHKYKFEVAFDYLQENKADRCITLSNGDFSPESFSWRGFFIGLPADFESRLSIFYSDFAFRQNKVVDIVSIPKLDAAYLEPAIDRLFEVVNNFNKTWQI